jgi:hypothetical protein
LPLGRQASWTPQEAIAKIQNMPFTVDELVWNASYNRYLGRLEVTLVRRVRLMYPPRDERWTWLWYVYEDTAEIESPFKRP